MKRTFIWTSWLPSVGALLCAILRTVAGEALGPLRIHPENPRYFTDGTKTPDGSLRAVYLTGAHTWNNLVDMGRGDPPEKFDWNAYLGFLEKHHHNFPAMGCQPIVLARVAA